MVLSLTPMLNFAVLERKKMHVKEIQVVRAMQVKLWDNVFMLHAKKRNVLFERRETKLTIFSQSGPLIVSGGSATNDVLVGVVSFGGFLCADPEQPGVYARGT